MEEYYLKVAGVTFRNPDGTDRQRIISKLHVGDGLRFVPEPNNPYDHMAVRVETESGVQIGYVPRQYNSRIFQNLMNGYGTYKLSVSSITGGGYATSYGLNFRVQFFPR